MKAEDLYEAINEIDDQLLIKAEDQSIIQHHYAKYIISIACCLSLFFASTFLWSGGSQQNIYAYYGAILPLEIYHSQNIDCERSSIITIDQNIHIQDQYILYNSSSEDIKIKLYYPYITQLMTNNCFQLKMNQKDLSYQLLRNQLIGQYQDDCIVYPENKDDFLKIVNHQSYQMSDIMQNVLLKNVYVYEITNLKQLEDNIHIPFQNKCLTYLFSQQDEQGYIVNSSDIGNPRLISNQPLDLNDLDDCIWKQKNMTFQEILDLCILEMYQYYIQNQSIAFDMVKEAVYEYLDLSLQYDYQYFLQSGHETIETLIMNAFCEWNDVYIYNEVVIPAQQKITLVFDYDVQYEVLTNQMDDHFIDYIGANHTSINYVKQCVSLDLGKNRQLVDNNFGFDQNHYQCVIKDDQDRYIQFQ